MGLLLMRSKRPLDPNHWGPYDHLYMCIHLDSRTVNSTGLVLDVLGALIILWRGLPPLIRMIRTQLNGKEWYEWELEDDGSAENQPRMKKLYARYATFRYYMIAGALMIILGFVLQALSSYL